MFPLCGVGARPGRGGTRPRAGSVVVPVSPVPGAGAVARAAARAGQSSAGPVPVPVRGSRDGGAENSVFIDTGNEVLPRRERLQSGVLSCTSLIRKGALIGEDWCPESDTNLKILKAGKTL